MTSLAGTAEAAIAAAAQLGVRVDPKDGQDLADHHEAQRRRAERLRALLVPADEAGRLDLRPAVQQ